MKFLLYSSLYYSQRQILNIKSVCIWSFEGRSRNKKIQFTKKSPNFILKQAEKDCSVLLSKDYKCENKFISLINSVELCLTRTWVRQIHGRCTIIVTSVHGSVLSPHLRWSSRECDSFSVMLIARLRSHLPTPDPPNVKKSQ